MDYVVVIRNVWKSYRSGQHTVTVLKNINAKFMRGEIVGIHGPSGSGKTTLLKLIAGLDRPDRGEIIVDGYNLNMLDDLGLALIRNTIVSYIPQDYGLLEELTVKENIELPLLLSGVPKNIRESKIDEILSYVKLTAKKDVKVSRLSSGEKQRVAIARALVTTPSVLLADEPTANLDWDNAVRVAELFRKIRNDFKTTVIIVTHDPRLLDFMDRSLTIVSGTLKEITPVKI
jgi:ABC-type lipoprotein export system ATPase subunit